MRAGAAMALGDLGDKRAVEPLLAVLSKSDSDSIRTGDVVAFGDRRAIEPLEVMLKAEKNENVRRLIEQALQRLRAVQPDKQ
jgi:HEAT repeat protein